MADGHPCPHYYCGLTFEVGTGTYLMMAQIQNQKGDKEAAIKSVEKALEAEPENGQAKQMLQQLKGGHELPNL